MTETTNEVVAPQSTQTQAGYRVDVFYNQVLTDTNPDGTLAYDEKGQLTHYPELKAASFPFDKKKDAVEKYQSLVRTGFLQFDLPFGGSGALRVESVNWVNVKQEAEYNDRNRTITEEYIVRDGDLISTLDDATTIDGEQVEVSSDASISDETSTTD